MILWLDAQISPRLCAWLRRGFSLEAVAVRDLGLREAEDPEIFSRARDAQVVVFTKDEDFVDLVRRLGSPPQVLWLTSGNMSNSRLKALLKRTLPDAIALLEQGEAIVEISRGEEVRRQGSNRIKAKPGRSRTVTRRG